MPAGMPRGAAWAPAIRTAPGLLASVANLAEMDAALAAGVDIVDLKDPARGALGAWEPKALVAAVSRWRAAGSAATSADGSTGPRPDGARPPGRSGIRPDLSATVGDHPLTPGTLMAAAMRTAATGVPLVKIGFALPPREAQAALAPCLAALRPLARDTRLIAVLFADQAPDLALVPRFAEAGFHGVMLDTADKAAGGLMRHMGLESLGGFVAAARACGLLTGLAGSLALEDIAPLSALGPHYLGFRGALCAGGRVAALDPARLAAVRGALRGQAAA
ncbi:(5-formylfuran-3-yl)methyl phosphate synthase [Xanthobacter sp. AM11]|uniref:(5-formylfuran-3-yl)methyl phosphate synthase n=1 Tax=Xanthobacter sp. AM11 TaxID=3380643 RepID=UPI0039BF9FD4